MAGARITPVVLCGGSGTRLWPLSRPHAPKPFLPLVGDRSLFEEALGRCTAPGFDRPIIVTGAAHLQLVTAQASAAELGMIVVEPEPKQTAAAVALAASQLAPDAVMLVCPSDHHIGRPDMFQAAAHKAAELAEDSWLVCLGVDPQEPATRFGYIRRGEPLGQGSYKVAEFVEKPDQAKADAFLESGDYAWNGGIFAFRAGDYLAELERHRPALAAAVDDAVSGGKLNGQLFEPDPAAFSAIEAESIDYAVMENSDRVAVVMTGDMQWSDVGDWASLKAARGADDRGNSVTGPADLTDCCDLLIDSDGPRVRAVGVDGLVIVVSGDDVLVARTGGSTPDRSVPGK